MAFTGGFIIKVTIIWGVLFITAWLGNSVVEKFTQKLPPKSLLRATDTAVHGLIGLFSFWLVYLLCPDLILDMSYLLSCLGFEHSWSQQRIAQINSIFSLGVAFMVSCIVDLDHVFKDIFHMIIGGQRVPWKRGFLHFSLPPLIFTLVMYISAVVSHSMWCLKLGTLSVVCIISHHIRDGMNHGLWLQPLGMSPQLPWWVYICITQFLPLGISAIVSVLLLKMKPSVSLSSERYIV
ncbi:hypothetical protein OTU49_003421 [Cherax quadricarinatus]|uniref:Transmembrane protein 267 n=2 Tax=Cherax quadricarinatus TaxID=27406 RepID=A0AAW0X5H3_CHEQU